MNVRLAASDDAEIGAIAEVMRLLRPAYTQPELIERIRQQQTLGYRLAYVEKDGEVICVAGFVVCHKLAWGKHIYVDDLVTKESCRSGGAGGLMIDWLKQHAIEQGCGQIHLDSGVQRFAAHRFYLRKGFDITGHHFAMTDLTQP